MKKLFLIFMSVVLSLSLLLTSCDGGENKADSGSGDSSSTVASQETPPTESSVESQSTSDESQTGEHIHDHGEWRTVSEPTCSKSGSRERVCSCGDRETEPLGTIPHKYVNNVCNMCGQKDPNVFVPDYAAGQANAVGADSGLSSYTIQADYIYFSDGNNIRKMKTDGTGLKTVYKVTAGHAMNVNVAGDWIYFWCNGETVGKSYIAKVRTDGTGFEKIVSSVYVWEMLVAKDTVYYTVYPVNGEYKDFAKDVCLCTAFR